jgi:hypothetical protein
MKIDELESQYVDQEFINNFVLLFGLKIFLNQCIISKDYDFNRIDSKSIVLSPMGLKLFAELKETKYPQLNDNLLKLGVFLEFYSTDLYVDVIKTDYQLLSKSVSDEIISGNILFPWIYGRTLYDKYFEEFNEQKGILENDNVIKLLSGTPKGVFQIGTQIVGPFGILDSFAKRLIPPTTNVKLWHCSDTSCSALHSVQLYTAETIISEILGEIDNLNKDVEPSEWYTFFSRQCQNKYSPYDDKKIDDIPITLVFAFGENELRKVLKEIIENKFGARDILPKEKKFQASSDAIVNSLSKAECFQLILLYDSIDIMVFTEKLIYEKKIYIPSTEIRSSEIQKSGGFFKIYHECNKLGFRAVSPNTQLSFIHLRNLILKLYSDPIMLQQLDWKLKYYEKESLKEKVEEYINKEEPRKIIRDLVLNGLYQVNKTFEMLQGYFKMPSTLEEEERIIDKVLWKLGFNVNIYPTFMLTFEDRLTKFNDIIRESNTYSKSDQERIRSAAVNLFVSLEEILKHTLAFSTWLLLSDHFRITRFKYNYTEATKFMTSTLNGYKLNDDTKLEFDSSGRNTLFPLIEGFSALFNICDSFLNEGQEKYKRDESEYPNFIGKTDLLDFPLNHKMLVFDIKNSSYLKIRELGLRLPIEFNKNKVLSVRNSLEHDREEFPQKNDLINACNCIGKLVEELKISGLFPNVYLFKSLFKDKHNRILRTFEDYNGRLITIPEIINYKGYPFPGSEFPQVIVPFLSFPESMEPLRVKYEENSEYLFYWQNYPRKKARQHKLAKESIDEN